MNAFTFRDQVVQSYERFSRSFVRIAAQDIEKVVNDEYSRGRYWPEPLIQINPNYKPGNTVAELAAEGVLHPLTAEIFKVGKDGGNPLSVRLYKHQQDALALAKAGRSFVVTTGTGSGKSLSFFIPIVDHILRAKACDPAPRTRAIIIYPMNALANSQAEEIGKFLQGVDGGSGGLTIARYTGQESQTERQRLTGQWSKQDEPESENGDEADEESNGKKFVAQRIVPFVEDHRNILILTPPEGSLPEASMATVQAALKRGIEQTFQIEAAELVVEPLPSAHDRRSILFYEAAEGGAGVLSRLAGDRHHFAQVARSALTFMHYQLPEKLAEPVSMDHLPDLAGAAAGPEAAQCEAGCYQCLLSYYNQPDHEFIDRRDSKAMAFLISLANSEVQPLRAVVPRPTSEDSTNPIEEWLSALSKFGLSHPDKTAVPVNGGEAMADASYHGARALIFLTAPPDGIVSYAQDRGFTLIVFPPDQAAWPPVFASHPSVFGTFSPDA